MPVEATIALAGKPPVIPELDLNKTYLTLGQLKYLSAEAARTQAQTGLVETQGAEALDTLAGRRRVRLAGPPGAPDPAAAGATLRSLGQPQASGPPFDEATLAGLPAGGSTPPPPATPAPGAAAAPPAAGPAPGGAPAAFDPYQRAAAMMQADPYEGAVPAKALLELTGKDLDIKKVQLEKASSALVLADKLWGAVTDQASHQRAREELKDATGSYGQIPETYTPEGTAQFRQQMRTAEERVAEALKKTELDINAHHAESTRITAEAGAARVPIEQQQADTAARLAKRPYTLGTGYGLDADVPPPKMVGPQPGASGAPRSPEGLAQANALSGEFNAGSKDFEATTAAYNQTVPMLKAATNTSDLFALRGFQKLSEAGQAIGVFGGKQTEALGNLAEQIRGEISRLSTDKGATIAPTLRAKMQATAKDFYAGQIDQHLQFRDEMRQKAKDRGVPPDEVAPNRLTTYGSGNTGKVLTQAKFKEILAGEQAKGKTRGAVLLDLADKGYHVRGGPE